MDTSIETLDQSLLDYKIFALRRSGFDKDEIAEQLGLSKRTVTAALKRAVTEYRGDAMSSAEEVRAVISARNEDLIRELLKKAIGEDGGINFYAIDRVIKLQDQQIGVSGAKIDRVDVTSAGERVGINAEEIREIIRQAEREIADFEK